MKDFGFQADLKHMVALADQRKAANRAAQARCKEDPELRTHLLADAKRRGLPEIDWSDYFRQLDINWT